MASVPKAARRPSRNAQGPLVEDARPSDKTRAGSLRVDLNQLKVPTLRKYTKVYEIPGLDACSSKEDLRSAVSKHWNTLQVSEEAVLQNLMRFRGR